MRERIDLAFHIMDREYGVTRLLDPEGEFQSIISEIIRRSAVNFFRIYFDKELSL